MNICLDSVTTSHSVQSEERGSLVSHSLSTSTNLIKIMLQIYSINIYDIKIKFDHVFSHIRFIIQI